MLEWLAYIARFILLLLLQLLVVNNIELSSYVNPYIYPAFILLLPINMKPWQVVVISFLTGVTMDSFSSTPGLHTAAINLMGYLRFYYLQAATTKEDQDGRVIPSVSHKGIVWFSFYAFFLILIHHFVLFFLEIYGLSEFLATVWRILLSTLVSVMLIVMGQLLFYNFNRKK